MKIIKFLILLLLTFFYFSILYAQENSNAKYINYLHSLKELWQSDFNIALEDYALYNVYEGEIIKNIYVLHDSFDFETQLLKDGFMNQTNHFLNQTQHFSLKETIIKNIFLKENDLFDVDLFSSSERYLRSLDFIQDVNFNIQKTETGIDIYISIKELYSYAPNIDQLGFQEQYIGLSNINLKGKGNSLGIDIYQNQKRYPHFGWKIHAEILNLYNSLIKIKGAYSRINENLYNHLKDEESIELMASLPLANDQKKWTGAAHIGHRRSLNRFKDEFQTGISPYQYIYLDIWTGLNINRLINTKKQLKHLLGLRYFNYYFIQQILNIPETYIGDSRYLNRKGLLVSLTFFQQHYYKTQFIHHFGINEDIPTGHNLKITLGYIDQKITERGYLGSEYYRYKLTSRGDLLHVFLKTSTYIKSFKKLEDWAFFAGISSYLKLVEFNQYRLRNYYRLTYAQINNYRLHEPLFVNQEFGIYGIHSELAQGKSRFSFRTESFLYFPKQLFGFNYAAIFITDLSYLSSSIPHQNRPQKQGLFIGIGSGLRLKNEQLGLNSIELRASILPNKLIGDDLFYFSIITNLNFTHTNKYVTPPSTANYNGDPEHLTF